MGEAEIDFNAGLLTIRSHFITYGHAADEALTERLRDETETLWNEPQAQIIISGKPLRVQFRITAAHQPHLTELEVYQNVAPYNNYFRIETFAEGNISFVDGIGCNSGYFLLENLYAGSTTAAHEYGHTLGLLHPPYLDLRGRGVPGIMYPRGTLVDPPYQYDPAKPAGVTGGTLHPMYRRVQVADIEALKLHRLRFVQGRALVGAFTNIYHWNHSE